MNKEDSKGNAIRLLVIRNHQILPKREKLIRDTSTWIFRCETQFKVFETRFAARPIPFHFRSLCFDQTVISVIRTSTTKNPIHMLPEYIQLVETSHPTLLTLSLASPICFPLAIVFFRSLTQQFISFLKLYFFLLPFSYYTFSKNRLTSSFDSPLQNVRQREVQDDGSRVPKS